MRYRTAETGRTLRPELHYVNGRFDDPGLARRRAILRETLERFENDGARLRMVAKRNIARWADDKSASPGADSPPVAVHRGDWGDVTGRLTREWGVIFAALNMANAYCPGGAYVEGTTAQEENMFRRTDCHFSILRETLTEQELYQPEMVSLLSGDQQHVYFDAATPRICIRGSEDREADDLGYAFLADDDIFPFYELRAAGQDLRKGQPFDEANARLRIERQLDTLVHHGIRHAVLSAFGCGAFRNPADQVAEMYRDALFARRHAFTHVAFAIFAPGYGPDNYTPFAEAFRR